MRKTTTTKKKDEEETTLRPEPPRAEYILSSRSESTKRDDSSGGTRIEDDRNGNDRDADNRDEFGFRIDSTSVQDMMDLQQDILKRSSGEHHDVLLKKEIPSDGTDPPEVTLPRSIGSSTAEEEKEDSDACTPAILLREQNNTGRTFVRNDMVRPRPNHHARTKTFEDVSPSMFGRADTPDKSPVDKLPLGVYYSGKLKKRSRNRSFLRSVTKVTSWKIRQFELEVRGEADILLKYAAPSGDRKVKLGKRKWEAIVLTPGMFVVSAENIPQFNNRSRDSSVSSPRADTPQTPLLLSKDVDSGATTAAVPCSPVGSSKLRYAFQLRVMVSDAHDSECVIECESFTEKAYGAWLKALRHAVDMLRREAKTDTTSISTTSRRRQQSRGSTKSDSSHFTASMMVETIQRSCTGSTLESSASTNQTNGWPMDLFDDDDEKVGEGRDEVDLGHTVIVNDSDTSSSGRRHRSSTRHPPIKIENERAIFVTSDEEGCDMTVRSDVVMSNLVPIPSRTVAAGKDGRKGSATGPMELGKGASGGAHLYRDRTNRDKMYAVKTVGLFGRSNRSQVLHELHALAQIENESEDEESESAMRRRRKQASDRHCVVHLYGHSIVANEVRLILEYMDLGGLDRLVRTGCAITERVAAAMMRQVFEALTYMKKEKNMMHRDIKPANLLWDRSGRVKVGDFGISRKLSNEQEAHTFLGTHLYMSPERYEPPYSYPADMYSTVIVLCELVSGIHPLIGRRVHSKPLSTIVSAAGSPDAGSPTRRKKEKPSEGQIQLKIFDSIRMDAIPLPMLASNTSELQTFARRALLKDASLRPKVEVAIEDPWFRAHNIDSVKTAIEIVRAYADTYDQYVHMQKEMATRVRAERARLEALTDEDADQRSVALRNMAIKETARLRASGLCPVTAVHETRGRSVA